MSAWVGKTKEELLKSWGPPTSISKDGMGGEILVYSSKVTFGQTTAQSYENLATGVSNTVPPKNEYERTRIFFVNKNHVIYNWRREGR